MNKYVFVFLARTRIYHFLLSLLYYKAWTLHTLCAFPYLHQYTIIHVRPDLINTDNIFLDITVCSTAEGLFNLLKGSPFATMAPWDWVWEYRNGDKGWFVTWHFLPKFHKTGSKVGMGLLCRVQGHVVRNFK